MMVQLLHLTVYIYLSIYLSIYLFVYQVRYDLLDCNFLFLDSVNKLIDLMEAGSVEGGAQLVPHLFQFLVMLANDSSSLVSIPQVVHCNP